MNENRSFLKTLATDLKLILESICGVALLGLFVGLLVAPLFEPLIEDRMMRDPDGSFVNLSQMPDIARQMIPIRIGLWIICIGAWSFVFWANLCWNYGN